VAKVAGPLLSRVTCALLKYTCCHWRSHRGPGGTEVRVPTRSLLSHWK